ncbi:thioredoxin family protein [Rhodovibrionaceae bacterium A322]
MVRRREFLLSAAAVGVSLGVASRQAAWASQGDAEVGDNGLHVQDWFLDSFLDLAEDQQTAADEGRRLVVLWEQRGCPYCRELHNVNLTKEPIVAYLQDHYDVLQLDLWGSRLVTDFDGEELEERDLARKWRVNFTPTIVFFPGQLEDSQSGQSGRDLEVARMPGYFKPFHFLSMFEYVEGDFYQEQSFQRFLQDKFERLKAEGKDIDVW